MTKRSLLIALVLLLYTACKEQPSPSLAQPLAQVQIKPIVKKFGFNFDNFDVVMDTIRRGEVFGELMMKYKADYEKVIHVANAYKDSFNVRKIKVGKPYVILKSKDSLNKAEVFIYEDDLINYTVVDLRDSAVAYRGKKKVTYREREISGVIDNSLYVTLDEQGIDQQISYHLANIYAWNIDFFRLYPGDRFKAIYKERYINDSIYAGAEEIQSAVFEHKSKPYYAFQYGLDSLVGAPEYYDEQAGNLRRTFLKAPVKFRNYRISSRYNLKRRIRYYGNRIRPHKGTDYAAPYGTPIIATADGVVTESDRRGGNGKYVKIRHNGTYSTQYLHMKAQKVRKGDRVRQGDVIGWIGMTGNTSGPHVCYRFWKNGEQVDPLREKLPAADPLADSLRPAYFEHIATLMERLESIPYTLSGEEASMAEQEIDTLPPAL